MLKLRSWFLLIGFCLLLASGYIYTQPFGTGEYRDSPNGRYQASADSLQRNTLAGQRIKYLKFSIHRDRTLVWEAIYHPESSDLWIDFGDRRFQFITWDESSSAATFQLANQRSLTIPVP